MKKFWIIIAIIAVLALSVMFSYNGLVSSQEQVNQSWAQVENVYQRRLDLIPNLVNTVKGYAAHEKQTFLAVTQARAQATQAISPAALNDPQKFAAFEQSQAAVSSALSRLLVVVERYPDLKANQNFLELQAQLEGTENRIAVERKRFNEAAQAYNVKLRTFPTMIVARLFGFNYKPYFQAESGAAVAPKVEF